MSNLEIEPTGEPPDFTYDTKNENEKLYALPIIGLLIPLFDKYENKSPDYAIKHISNDMIPLKKNMTTQIMKLELIFNNEVSTTLIEAGIVVDNIPKAKIKPTLIQNGVLEQKNTIQSIVSELETGITSKAFYLKNRGNESIFNVANNFRDAVRRTKSMIKTGYRTTVSKAKREAQVFLYGDPLADWITADDDNVCIYCEVIEDESPMPLSKMPIHPLHPHCGERCKIEIRDEKELDLTQEAMDLTYYDI